MNKTKKLNKWTKNLTDRGKNPEYINKNKIKNILSREEEKNETYSKRKESQNSDEKDNSETSVDDMSSSISTASIGHILTKAFSNIQISENMNKENMNKNQNKKRIGRNAKRYKEPETSYFKGSFSFSSIKGTTVSQTMVSQKSQDKMGKIKQMKYKSKSIKQKDKDGKVSYEKREAYDNGGTEDLKKMYKKKSDDKLFKKVHKVNKNTGTKEQQHVEYADLNNQKNKSKNEEEDIDFYIWSYKERHEPKEEDINFNNIYNGSHAIKNKLKVGERKYHKKKVC